MVTLTRLFIKKHVYLKQNNEILTQCSCIYVDEYFTYYSYKICRYINIICYLFLRNNY